MDRPDPSPIGQGRPPCLWHAKDGRCANCKARRIRCDVLGLKDYDLCTGQADYKECPFYTKKPMPPGR